MSDAQKIIDEIRHLRTKLTQLNNFTGKTLSISITGDRDDINLHDVNICQDTFETIQGHMAEAIAKEIECLEIKYHQM